jgi:hypothetical protein
MAIGCEVLAPGTVCSSNGICLQDANNNSYCLCTVAGFGRYSFSVRTRLRCTYTYDYCIVVFGTNWGFLELDSAIICACKIHEETR